MKVTLGILEISFNNELNIIAILRAYFLLKNSTTFTITFNNNFMSYSWEVTET